MGKSAQRPTSRRATEILVGAAVVGTAVLAVWWAGGWQPLWELFTDQYRVRQLVEQTGPLAPWAYVLLLVVQAVVLPLPAPPVAIAGGYVFGTLQGFILTWTGVLLGGAASFGISRLFGRRFVAESVRAQRLDRHVEEHGALIVFVLRLIPLISFDAISYAAGLTGLPFWKFLLATALGMIPGTFAFVYLGGAPSEPGAYVALGGLAALAVAAYAYYRHALAPWKARR